MSRTSVPSVCGQLVWCPSDPSQGIGRVVETEHRRVKVWFAHADVGAGLHDTCSRLRFVAIFD